MSFLDKLLRFGDTIVQQVEHQRAEQMRKEDFSIGGKSIRLWEASWRPLGILSSANISHLSGYVGLYRANLNGKIVYIGRAVEYDNGGLRKRLSDYTRESDSARKHRSGQLMHQHASELFIDVLITGSDSDAADVAKNLEPYLIGKYRPEWNKMLN